MSSVEEGFSPGFEATAVVVVDNAGWDEGFRKGSEQAFFEGEGLTTIVQTGAYTTSRRIRPSSSKPCPPHFPPPHE